MTDEEALLRAVIADPDDDAPRLIYADWLDENGQCERAEFIRIQIALHGMPVDDARRPELRRAERRLLRRNGDKWTDHWRPLIRHYSFRRGFVDTVICLADEFVSGGDNLLSLAPIEYLWLLNPHFCSASLSRCPYLSRPIRLILSHSWLGDRDVHHFANSPFFGHLVGLSLARNRITGVGAVSLARSPFLGSLDDLDLNGNDIPRQARAELRRRFGSRVHF